MKDYFAGDPRTTRERMLAGDLYVADDPESGRIAQRAVRLATRHTVEDIIAPTVQDVLTTARAEVVSVTPETARAATVTLRPGAGWQPHRPGQ